MPLHGVVLLGKWRRVFRASICRIFNQLDWGALVTYVSYLDWCMFALVIVFKIEKKPILNPKIGEPVMQSLKEGIRVCF